MATTTNFGWETPDDTDLVKDGAAAMRTLGNSIDTSFVDLKGGTSGQILSKASNTDLDYTWIDNQVGDITSITATSPLTGGGTGGDVTVGIQAGSTTQSGALQLTDSTSSTSTTTAATPNAVKSAYDLAGAAIPKSTATTAGDLLYRNGSAVTRLGIGTAGQVLTVNSGATAPEWAAAASSGGLTLISTTTLSGSSINLTSFSSGYKSLRLVIENCYGTAADWVYLRFNSDTANVYSRRMLQIAGTSVGGGTSSQTNHLVTQCPTTNQYYLNAAAIIEIPLYTETSGQQIVFSNGFGYDSTNNFGVWNNGVYGKSAAITTITVGVASGTFSGGVVKFYGVN